MKNLAGHDRGRTFNVILRTLEKDLDYFIEYRILDAAPYVPQHRERLYIVGFREPKFHMAGFCRELPVFQIES